MLHWLQAVGRMMPLLIFRFWCKSSLILCSGLHGWHCQLSLVKDYFRFFSYLRCAISVVVVGHMDAFSYRLGKPLTQQLILARFACFQVISSCPQIFGLGCLAFSKLSPSCLPNVSEIQRDPRIIKWIPKLAVV